jgi:nucleotide-binding universal stress UspA family protein
MPLALTMIHVLRDECRMKKVWVAVDGSDKSLEAADYAMSIANKEHAQLIILNVLDTEPWFYERPAYGWARRCTEKGLAWQLQY